MRTTDTNTATLRLRLTSPLVTPPPPSRRHDRPKQRQQQQTPTTRKAGGRGVFGAPGAANTIFKNSPAAALRSADRQGTFRDTRTSKQRQQ